VDLVVAFLADRNLLAIDTVQDAEETLRLLRSSFPNVPHVVRLYLVTAVADDATKT